MSDTTVDKGFTLFVEVTIRDGRMEDFLAHYSTMLQQITSEEGFLSIEVFRSDKDSHRLCWVENWAISRSWFDENILTKSYVQEYLKATELLCVGQRSLEMWNRLGGSYAIANRGVYQEPFSKQM